MLDMPGKPFDKFIQRELDTDALDDEDTRLAKETQRGLRLIAEIDTALARSLGASEYSDRPARDAIKYLLSYDVRNLPQNTRDGLIQRCLQYYANHKDEAGYEKLVIALAQKLIDLDHPGAEELLQEAIKHLSERRPTLFEELAGGLKEFVARILRDNN